MRTVAGGAFHPQFMHSMTRRSEPYMRRAASFQGFSRCKMPNVAARMAALRAKYAADMCVGEGRHPAGWLRHPAAIHSAGAALAKYDRPVLDVGLDHVAVAELAVQHGETQRVEEVVLDGAFEGACAVNRVVALVAEEFLGGRR